MAQAGPVGVSVPPVSSRKLTGRVKVFLGVIRAEPGISVLAACQKAGYGKGRWQASKLERKWGKEIEEARVEGLKSMRVSAEEAESGLAEIARNPLHRDRIKALEMFLKMHGKLSDKLTVTFDRQTLNQRLDELLVQMAEQRAIDTAPQHAESKLLPAGESAEASPTSAPQE